VFTIVILSGDRGKRLVREERRRDDDFDGKGECDVASCALEAAGDFVGWGVERTFVRDCCDRFCGVSSGTVVVVVVVVERFIDTCCFGVFFRCGRSVPLLRCFCCLRSPREAERVVTPVVLLIFIPGELKDGDIDDIRSI